MTLNKIKFIIFLLMLSINVVLPTRYSFAAEARLANCTRDTIDKQKDFMQNEAVRAANAMKSAFNTYNAAAKDYINQCHSGMSLKRPSLMPNSNEVSAAQTLGIDLGMSVEALNLYKYSGIVWDAEGHLIPECETKKNKAQSLMENVRAKYIRALKLILAASTDGRSRRYNCTCDDSGNVKRCTYAVPTGEVLHQTSGCAPFTTLHGELTNNGGPLGDVYAVILRTLSGIAHVAWISVTPGLIKVVQIFFLALLAFEALKAVGGMAGSSISAFLKNVLLIGFKIAITVLLLSKAHFIYGMFVSPVIQGGLDLGLAISEASGAGVHCSASSNLSLISTEEFDPQMLNQINSTVRCFGSSAAITPAIGRGLMCNAWTAGPLSLPDFSMWFTGLVMLGFGLMIWLAISFYLVDCTVQLGMLSAVIPLLVACWPFKMTENYSYKGVKMLMNTFFNYTMMGIVLLLGTKIISYAATGNNAADESALIEALNNNDIDALKKLTDLSGFQTLILIACAIFAMKMIGNVNDLADQFSKGGGSGIAAKMGGMATSAVTSAAKAAGGAALSGAATAGKAVADATGATTVAKKAVGGIQQGHKKLWQFAGKKAGLGQFQNQQQGGNGGGGDK